jgi:hypothetical protein
VALPFDFSLFGTVWNEVGISSNGYLQFAPPPALNDLRAATNRPIPDPRAPNELIAVFWDDLAPPAPPAGSHVLVFPVDASPRQGFAVHWSDWSFFGVTNPPARLEFQAVLWDDGGIDLHYCRLEDSQNPTRATGASATVGIEDVTGTRGLQHSFNQAGAVSTTTGIRYTPLP